MDKFAIRWGIKSGLLVVGALLMQACGGGGGGGDDSSNDSGSSPKPTPAALEIGSENQLNTNYAVMQKHKVVTNDAGDALAVWMERADQKAQIKARLRSGETGEWGSTTIIGNSAAMKGFDVAMNPSGVAFVLRLHAMGGLYYLDARRFDPVVGWQGFKTLVSNQNELGEPQVCIDDDGRAITVWSQVVDGRRRVMVRYFDKTSLSWLAVPYTVDAHPSLECHEPQLAMNALGSAVVAYRLGSMLAVRKYSPEGKVWQTAKVVSGNGEIGEFQVALDGFDRGVVLYTEMQEGSFDLHLRTLTAANDLTKDQLVEENDGVAGSPVLAVDSQGTALVIWTQFADGLTNVWSRRYYLSLLGDTPNILNTQGSGGLTGPWGPQMAMDFEGNAIVVWVQAHAGKLSILASRFDRDANGWSAPVPIEGLGDLYASNPRIAMGFDGEAIVTFNSTTSFFALSTAGLWFNTLR